MPTPTILVVDDEPLIRWSLTTRLKEDGYRLLEAETAAGRAQAVSRWGLSASKDNKSRAAELLQIKRSTLGDRIKHCGLDRNPVQSAAPVTG
ncbi:MAG: helix-turn-helix domain-containing protein [Acidobacteriota bacterium]